MTSSLCRLPLDFWRLLHAECGILIYPSAWTHEVDIIPTNQLFTSVYIGHISECSYASACDWRLT